MTRQRIRENGLLCAPDLYLVDVLIEIFFSKLVAFEKNKNKNVVEFVWEQHAQCAGVHNLGLLLSGI